jgi:hypothetical protein
MNRERRLGHKQRVHFVFLMANLELDVEFPVTQTSRPMRSDVCQER